MEPASKIYCVVAFEEGLGSQQIRGKPYTPAFTHNFIEPPFVLIRTGLEHPQ